MAQGADQGRNQRIVDLARRIGIESLIASCSDFKTKMDVAYIVATYANEPLDYAYATCPKCNKRTKVVLTNYFSTFAVAFTCCEFVLVTTAPVMSATFTISLKERMPK